MQEPFVETVPVLRQFELVADAARYVPIPDDWQVGLSDVVASSRAIEAGRYKAVNLAGAAGISAVTNALGGRLPLFSFGGDGARFAVSPDQAAAAAEALARVARWAARDLDLQLRVGMTPVAGIRAAGQDVRVALLQASDHVRYAMFAGGGLAWAEAELKRGAIGLPADTAAAGAPDLTGLSCQWGPIRPRHGKILSLIVKPVPGASQARFAALTATIAALSEGAARANPVPEAGPQVAWPSRAIALQSRVAQKGLPIWLRRLSVVAAAALAWLVFKLNLGVGGFDPRRYRREIAANTDFRKFDDGLMMTVDGTAETEERLRAILDDAAAEGLIRYGLHAQAEAIMTCVVPSVMTSAHVHFVDGADGGYASAAQHLRGRAEAARV